MKINTLVLNNKLILALVCLYTQFSIAQTTVFWKDDFENASIPDIAAGSTRTPSMNMGSTASYFKRSSNTSSDISLNAAFGTTYSGMSGSFIWAGEDHDAAGGTQNALSAVQTIEWTNINISGKTSIKFLGLFAANNVNIAWDNGTNSGGSDPVGPTGSNDYILVEYAIDAGAYTRLALFIGDNINAVGGKSLKEDTDGDGLGDGTQLNIGLNEISKSIAGTGTTLKLKISVRSNGGNEEWAIDNFRLTNTTLPVELVNFNAVIDNKKVALNWETVSEKNNAYFDIERSSDGKHFTSLGRINGHGTINTPQFYSFIDENPIAHIHYYRLKQVDSDGSFTYSKTQSIQLSKFEKIEIYPTTTEGVVTIENPEVAIENIAVINIYGQVVLNKNYNNTKTDLTQLKLHNLNTGFYLISVKTNNGLITQKVFKK